MKLLTQPLPGVSVLQPFAQRDHRGDFVKPFHEEQLAQHGIEMHVREEFYSTSQAGVLRGMHFQLPPFAHQKLIYCIAGRVLDVLLDLRKASPTYGQSAQVELSADNHHVLHIPVGFAHGFLSLEADSCLIYKTDALHSPSHDVGVLWNSFGLSRPCASPLLSERDSQFPPFPTFVSPF